MILRDVKKILKKLSKWRSRLAKFNGFNEQTFNGTKIQGIKFVCWQEKIVLLLHFRCIKIKVHYWT